MTTKTKVQGCDCREKEKYNGWTNYETWNVKLWIDNDESSYSYWRERAKQHMGYAKEHHESYNTPEQSANYALSRELEEGIKDESPDLGASMYADILGAALSVVNWHEIAESLISDLSE